MTGAGVAMVAACILLLLLALPRGGAARPFLRGEGLSSAYAVAMVMLFLGGVALIVAGLI
jgi:hypothetical protein